MRQPGKTGEELLKDPRKPAGQRHLPCRAQRAPGGWLASWSARRAFQRQRARQRPQLPGVRSTTSSTCGTVGLRCRSRLRRRAAKRPIPAGCRSGGGAATRPPSYPSAQIDVPRRAADRRVLLKVNPTSGAPPPENATQPSGRRPESTYAPSITERHGPDVGKKSTMLISRPTCPSPTTDPSS